MNPTHSKNVAILLALSLGVLSLVLGLGIFRANRFYKEANELTMKASEVEAQERSFRSLRSIQSVARGDLDRLESVTFTTDKVVLAIDGLERSAEALKLEVKITSVEKVEGGLMLGLEARGAFPGLFSLLTIVDNFVYKTEVQDVQFDKSVEGWSLRLNFIIPTFD